MKTRAEISPPRFPSHRLHGGRHRGARQHVFDLTRVAAAAGLNAGDYKALVCVFLYGGNDSNNVLIPRGTGYNAYAAARGTLALPSASLLPITPLSGAGGGTWGLHPSLTGLSNLFSQQH